MTQPNEQLSRTDAGTQGGGRQAEGRSPRPESPQKKSSTPEIGQEQSKAMTRAEDLASPRMAGMFSTTPFSLMRVFAEQMDDLFEGFAFNNPFGMFGWSPPTPMFPPMEVTERNGEFLVRVDLPGVKKENITAQVTDDVLTVAAERQSDFTDQKEGWTQSERTYGQFTRTIPLPQGVQAESATASFHNGVLELSFKRAPEDQRTRSLEIREGPPQANRSSASPPNTRH